MTKSSNAVLSPFDKFVEAACLLLLAALWVGTAINYSKLPDQVPSHFNAGGVADAWDGKESIWVPLIIATAIYFVLTFIGRQSSWHKQLRTSDIQDRENAFRQSSRLMSIIKLAVLIIFSEIVFNTFRIALYNGDGLGRWFLPLVIVLIAVPNVVYLIQAFRANGKPIEQR